MPPTWSDADQVRPSAPKSYPESTTCPVRLVSEQNNSDDLTIPYQYSIQGSGPLHVHALIIRSLLRFGTYDGLGTFFERQKGQLATYPMLLTLASAKPISQMSRSYPAFSSHTAHTTTTLFDHACCSSARCRAALRLPFGWHELLAALFPRFPSWSSLSHFLSVRVSAPSPAASECWSNHFSADQTDDAVVPSLTRLNF